MAGGDALGEHGLLDLGALGRGHGVAKTIEGQEEGEAAFGGALQAEDLAALDEAVPLLEIEHAPHRELGEVPLDGVAVDEVDERGAIEYLLGVQQVRDLVGRAEFLCQEGRCGGDIGREQRLPVGGEAGVLRVGADAREVGLVKQEPAAPAGGQRGEGGSRGLHAAQIKPGEGQGGGEGGGGFEEGAAGGGIHGGMAGTGIRPRQVGRGLATPLRGRNG